MKQKIKLVVFDMAGTTIDEDNVVYKTILATIQAKGFNVDLPKVLTYCAGKEKQQAIKDLMVAMNFDHDDTLIEELFNDFKIRLSNAYDNLKVKSFIGVEDLFSELKNKSIKVALNTGYDSSTASKLLNNLKWTEGVEYDTLVTADDVINGRPHPDMILKAMDKTGVISAANVAKIGDSIVDIQEGQAADCLYSIGVTTGAQNREQLASANPTHIFDELKELLSFI